MAKYIMVATSTAKEGRDAEYNAWYDTHHLKDVCAVPGFTSGQRWRAMPEASPNTPPADYIAIYEIEADDPSKVVGELLRRAQAGEIELSADIDMDSANIWIFEKY
ncbi:MAG: DUF4286 family protein [Sphingomonadaceae bacterium]